MLGIVASRGLLEIIIGPTIIIGFDEKGVGKGSGTEHRGLNLVDALTRCAATLEKFGGHEMAAGLALHEENFSEICRSVLQHGAPVTFRTSSANARCDWITSCVQNIDVEFLRWHELLQPFGNEIRSQFSCTCGRASRARESQTKSISYFGCARARGIRRAVYFDVRRMNFRRRPGTSHFALGWMNYGGETWLACGSKACAQPRRLETPSSNGMTSVSTNLEDLSWIPRPRLLALRRLGSRPRKIC